ncbi:hypothetical protein AVEN_267430-1 [Araneus ventricosus]|uniref:DNA polymerase n=2 Tax=Araneus ventricosus TaxID=182803 RepID=A0A4Y2LYC7_ARAVE|nr:hypothetical protein AVEN_267430-1 [Araneus ventricosus]
MWYSIRWEKVPRPPGCYEPHIIHVKTTFLDEEGQMISVTRLYEEWIGVCTNRIDKIVSVLQESFPNCPVRYVCLGQVRKILPYLEQRFHKLHLDSPTKPFYKVYIRANTAEVGQFLNKFKVSYYEKNDWLVRIYIDLCTKYQTQGFYYKWYTVANALNLMDSFEMHPDQTHTPDWTIAAFDIETVPMDGGNRIPTGLDKTDEIVMISLYIWNRKGLKYWLLYRLPCETEPIDMEHTYAYTCEKKMLNDFHCLIKDCHVLTGYNIYGFDLPCIFLRLFWLDMPEILRYYSSVLVGRVIVPTFKNKLCVDEYHYFRIFSNYNLPGFKLDDVAKKKLNEAKVPIQSMGLWSWYTHPGVDSNLVHCASLAKCYDTLKPFRIPITEFGTFRDYMRYCLKDSCLVYRLFELETILNFLVERANFTDWNAVQALLMGNSGFLLQVFKTYGTRLGFFINAKFLKSPIDPKKYASLFVNKSQTYQGALNYIDESQDSYADVSVMDFASMYPSALVSGNLCYGTCTILSREEWLACPRAQTLKNIPYRTHGEQDFVHDAFGHGPVFQYPPYDPTVDNFVIVINEQSEAFLPCIVRHFVSLREHHQRKYKETKDVYHYNAQLCIKILINSLYGVMANKESCLAYLPIAMIIVTLARYQLLGAYHYLKRQNYLVCYADTDSLMVQSWPENNCDSVNAYLNLSFGSLKYEQRMTRLLVLSRKRYIYQTSKGQIVTKGFQKRTNEIIEFISQLVLENVWSFIFNVSKPVPDPAKGLSYAWLEENLSMESRGWILWADIMQQVQYKCRDAKKYSIYRKTKHLEEYKSPHCAAVRMLEKHPEKQNDFIEYTYSRADVSAREASKWVMDARECKWVNCEQLFMSQKKIFCLLLNKAFWKRPQAPMDLVDMVMNALRWKQFMHAELLYWHKTRERGNARKIIMLVEKGLKYTFCVNVHIKKVGRQIVRRARKRKAAEEETQ